VAVGRGARERGSHVRAVIRRRHLLIVRGVVGRLMRRAVAVPLAVRAGIVGSAAAPGGRQIGVPGQEPSDPPALGAAALKDGLTAANGEVGVDGERPVAGARRLHAGSGRFGNVEDDDPTMVIWRSLRVTGTADRPGRRARPEQAGR
jgi:hypothetical protein